MLPTQPFGRVEAHERPSHSDFRYSHRRFLRGGRRRRAADRSARLSQITTFDEGDTTIPTVLGFSELACAEAPDTALVETAYRIGSARGRALGAVLRGLAEDAPLDRW